MNCLPCFFCLSKPKTPKRDEDEPQGSPEDNQVSGKNKEEGNNVENGNIKAQTFSFRELATATKNFKQECLLGEGGFGRVYKGQLKGEQTVAVKKLDRNGLQGNKEFLVEVLMLSQLHHQNLVNLIGYCADGEQRLLVYEYMPRGSLEDHLLDLEPDSKPLDWFTRMRIAVGAAEGLEYLHVKANPPVIYRDLKSSNILLDDQFSPKLSDFGLAKLGPIGEKVHVSSRVMGTYGYCAPEYTRTGQLTVQSDVYSFGVVLLELITGRRVVDPTKPIHEQNLISWAQPIFKDPRRFHELADPRLNSDFPERGLNQAVAITAMCLQDESSARPMITDVITAIRFLAMAPKEERMSTSSPNEAKSHDGSGSQHRGSTHDVADCSKDDNVSSSSGSYSISSGRTVENSDSRGRTGSGSSGHHSSSRNHESREGDGSTGSSNSCRSQPHQGDHTSAGSSEDGENQWVVEKCSSDFEKSCSSDRLEEGDNCRISSNHAIKEKE